MKNKNFISDLTEDNARKLLKTIVKQKQAEYKTSAGSKEIKVRELGKAKA